MMLCIVAPGNFMFFVNTAFSVCHSFMLIINISGDKLFDMGSCAVMKLLSPTKVQTLQ